LEHPKPEFTGESELQKAAVAAKGNLLSFSQYGMENQDEA